MKKYKCIVLIGRFEPVHNGHLANFIQAIDSADRVIILVGSSYQPRTPKNPFSFSERCSMITSSIEDVRPLANYCLYPLRDFKYSNNNWIAEVQQLVKQDSPFADDREIAIMGYDKDESSWYNHAFPEWKFLSTSGFVMNGTTPIDATKIRELYFEDRLDYISGVIPKSVFSFLKNWTSSSQYKKMVEEYIFYKDYHRKWAAAPFVPIFQTTDAVVIQGGYVLLIQRGHSPGRGLWALPGGFINPTERIIDCLIRELIEETKIKVPETILRKSITSSQIFDHPDRDLRGRTITNASLIELTGGTGSLPPVKGSDDAKVAKWFKLSEIKDMGELLYGDHQHIIDTMVSRARL